MLSKSRITYLKFKSQVIQAIEDNKNIASDKEYRVKVGEIAKEFKKVRFGLRAKKMGAKWEAWISDIELELGEDWSTVRNLTSQRIDDLADGTAALAHAFPIHYRLHGELDFPEFAKTLDEFVFEKKYKTKHRKPVFERDMRPMGVVRLGPITISLDYDVNSYPLSLQEPQSNEFLHNGLPDVFKALDWRSRLTSLHGRADQYKRLSKWALDTTTKAPKLMLVSGPGGSGKSRLVADVVSKLVNSHGWVGGFLPNGAISGAKLDGGGKGVALIIDYPEERPEFIKEILTSIADDTEYNRPVRIILASRESLEDWKMILNDPNPDRIEEIMLGASPYLSIKDAQQVVEDVAETYPTQIGKAKSLFSGIEEWLNLHHSHRLPLIALAASVHSVLEPERAFTLSGKDVLMTLAKIELKRVRSYSKRDLGDRTALEKLLALSLLTSTGLFKDTVCALGEAEICPGKSGMALLDAIQKTPFWHSKAESQPSHLLRLQPDRPAAAFFQLALSVNDPSPRLHCWFASVAEQETVGFGGNLSRISYDIAQFDPKGSIAVERTAIEFLDKKPELVERLRVGAFQQTTVFSAAFNMEILKRLLAYYKDETERAYILNNIANRLLEHGKWGEALEYSEKAVSAFRLLSKKRPKRHLGNLASSLSNQAGILNELGQKVDALGVSDEALMIYLEEAKAGKNIETMSLLKVISNHAVFLSGGENLEEAIRLSKNAVSLYRNLEGVSGGNHHIGLASSLLNLGSQLAQDERPIEGNDCIEEAVAIFRNLDETRSDLISALFAKSLDVQSNLLRMLGKSDQSKSLAMEALERWRQLEAARPKVFFCDLVQSLNKLALTLKESNQFTKALEIYNEAICILRINVSSGVKTSLQLLAITLDLTSKTYLEIGQPEEAWPFARESLLILKSLPSEQLATSRQDLASALDTNSRILSNLGQPSDALRFSLEAVKIYREVSKIKPRLFLADLAASLNNLSNRHMSLECYEGALECSKEALSIRRSLAEENLGGSLSEVAVSLSNSAAILHILDQNVKSLKYVEEAVEIRSKLAAKDPEKFYKKLAGSLINMASILSGIGENSAAFLRAREAVSLLAPRFSTCPEENYEWMIKAIQIYCRIGAEANFEIDDALIRPIHNLLQTFNSQDQHY